MLDPAHVLTDLLENRLTTVLIINIVGDKFFFSVINRLIVGALFGFTSEYGDTTSGNLYCRVVAQDVFGKFIHDERGA